MSKTSRKKPRNAPIPVIVPMPVSETVKLVKQLSPSDGVYRRIARWVTEQAFGQTPTLRFVVFNKVVVTDHTVVHDSQEGVLQFNKESLTPKEAFDLFDREFAKQSAPK